MVEEGNSIFVRPVANTHIGKEKERESFAVVFRKNGNVSRLVKLSIHTHTRERKIEKETEREKEKGVAQKALSTSNLK